MSLVNSNFQFSKDVTANSIKTNKLSSHRDYRGIINSSVTLTSNDSGIYEINETFGYTITLPRSPGNNYFKFISNGTGSTEVFQSGSSSVTFIGVLQNSGTSVKINSNSTSITSTTNTDAGDTIEFQGIGHRWLVTAISSHATGFSN